MTYTYKYNIIETRTSEHPGKNYQSCLTAEFEFKPEVAPKDKSCVKD